MQLTSTHSQPVIAGTIVVFYATPDPASGTAPEGQFRWRVHGPDSKTQTPYPSSKEGSFDWDTSGLRAGAYDVHCEFVPKDGVPTVLPTDELGVDGIAPPDGAPVGPTRPSTVTVNPPGDTATQTIYVQAALGGASTPSGAVPVSLQRTSISPTDDQFLWVVIRNRTNAIGFRSYRTFIDSVLCSPGSTETKLTPRPSSLLYRGADAYNLLKYATDVFLMHETGVIDDDLLELNHRGGGGLSADETIDDLARLGTDDSEARRLGRTSVSVNDLRTMRDGYYVDLLDDSDRSFLPYLRIIRERLKDIPLKQSTDIIPNCYGILRSNLMGPLAMELVWSYWHEEGMLVQTLNAILARFQNRRLGRTPDPLARFDLDPLRPLSNLFWGWVQDEVHRLTVRRRAFEYEHEYGLRLIGKAVPELATVDRRSKFIESYHNMLYVAHVFFAQDDDTTIIADGFPLLNALRETHLLLAEGAHNQFGDLPSAARSEMLIMQWLLARPEMREFLGGRIMVPYEEEWMDRVDMMKSVQNWTDVSITHFRDMGVYGEQILLSVRYGNWSTANDPQQAANWARYWRPEIQRYAHAFRAATGVDLSERVDATMPSDLLQRRITTQRRAQ